MEEDNTTLVAMKLAKCFRGFCALVLAVSGSLLLIAVLLRPSAVGADSNAGPGRQMPPMPALDRDVAELSRKILSTELIKPSQARAAVKDDGTARRLAERLKLLGVAQHADERIAYIAVANEGVKTVRKGERVGQFLVNDIADSSVTLVLQGVEIVLGL